MNIRLIRFSVVAVLAALVGCDATTVNPSTATQQNQFGNKPENMQNTDSISNSLLTKKPKTNLLHYANPGFEMEIDGELVKARNDKDQETGVLLVDNVRLYPIN